jgi:DDE family transposase
MAANEYDLWIKVWASANEAQKRQIAAVKALELGWGGITAVEELTGMSHSTIRKGIQELRESVSLNVNKRIRKTGGGRKKVEINDRKIIEDIEKIMDENTAGDPMSLLKWTNKSTYTITEDLMRQGHSISPNTVSRLLKERDYSLQTNMKTIEGGTNPKRDAQFQYINQQVKHFIEQGDPVISVDTKKKENVGNFKNNGSTWEKKGQPTAVNVYDFVSLGIGIAIPYGIYDVNNNNGFVNVGVSYDTSEFAVESIRQWWNIIGKYDYSNPNRLLVCCDGGGSNGRRRKGWKYYLQELADELGISITVCHLPPGTSKWNKIEHRMFSFISMNWKGKPLTNYETIINLISSTKTKTGLTVLAQLDQRRYKKGKKFTDMDMAKLNIQTHTLHPKWNYTIIPKDTSDL